MILGRIPVVPPTPITLEFIGIPSNIYNTWTKRTLNKICDLENIFCKFKYLNNICPFLLTIIYTRTFSIPSLWSEFNYISFFNFKTESTLWATITNTQLSLRIKLVPQIKRINSLVLFNFLYWIPTYFNWD